MNREQSKIVQQYGVRWSTGAVFSYPSRAVAEAAIAENAKGCGVLVVHEGIAGRPESEWTNWEEPDRG
jgi:hypothetical protein